MHKKSNPGLIIITTVTIIIPRRRTAETINIKFVVNLKPTQIRWSPRFVFRRRPASLARRRPVAIAASAQASPVLLAGRRRQRRRPFPIRAFATSPTLVVRLCCRRSNRRWPRGVAGTVCPAATICTCDSRNTVRWRASVVLRDSFALKSKNYNL